MVKNKDRATQDFFINWREIFPIVFTLKVDGSSAKSLKNQALCQDMRRRDTRKTGDEHARMVNQSTDKSRMKPRFQISPISFQAAAVSAGDEHACGSTSNGESTGFKRESG